ncbi:hypothetical protein FEM03_16670 [Phragmitibacter flavus]|uniref:Uncharacterized protein n=1 Tax=Phragmitibacter flavus TaxID=2576071 RepID=A0A5R8KBB8_9BACT|nr:hypothetical protein [Phragmitibacter flavus]TLD69591.1 hypothetical protein FEM03_16670 [Phragmitibacter flavus]
MKKRYLALLIPLLIPSGGSSQDIVDEALKVTPPGFTDLVPRRTRGEPKIIDKEVDSKAVLKFHPTLWNSNSNSNPNPGDILFYPNPGDILFFNDASMEELKIELKVLRRENEELKRKLEEIQRIAK